MNIRERLENHGIWWNGQTLPADGIVPKHWRGWFGVPGNVFHCAVALRANGVGFEIEAGDYAATSEPELCVYLALPFISFLFSVDRFPLLLRLPGVKWQDGAPYSAGLGRRSIGFNVRLDSLWIYPWINREQHMPISFNINDFLFGRVRTERIGLTEERVLMAFPEGYYLATVEMYTTVWRRPRWPLVHSERRATVTVSEGVPLPGKGENDYDCDDDALHSSTSPAATLEDAVAAFRNSVLEARERYGSEDWKPRSGWPDHLIQLTGITSPEVGYVPAEYMLLKGQRSE